MSLKKYVKRRGYDVSITIYRKSEGGFLQPFDTAFFLFYTYFHHSPKTIVFVAGRSYLPLG